MIVSRSFPTMSRSSFMNVAAAAQRASAAANPYAWPRGPHSVGVGVPPPTPLAAAFSTKVPPRSVFGRARDAVSQLVYGEKSQGQAVLTPRERDILEEHLGESVVDVSYLGAGMFGKALRIKAGEAEYTAKFLLREVEGRVNVSGNNELRAYSKLAGRQRAAAAKHVVGLVSSDLAVDTRDLEDEAVLILEYVRPLETYLGTCNDLHQLMRTAGGGLASAQIGRYMQQLLLGLAHLNDSMVVHLDLKPDNVLISQEGVIKITDFGLSAVLSARDEVLDDARFSIPMDQGGLGEGAGEFRPPNGIRSWRGMLYSAAKIGWHLARPPLDNDCMECGRVSPELTTALVELEGASFESPGHGSPRDYVERFKGFEDVI